VAVAVNGTDSPPGPGVLVRLLAAFLVGWEPLALALVASSALERLLHYGVPALALLGYRMLVTGIGLAAGRALWTGRPGGVRLARMWAVAAAIATGVTFWTPYFPSNRVPGTKGPTLAAILLFDAAVYAYLTRSARVRAAFPEG
jgi:hypothetical protein